MCVPGTGQPPKAIILPRRRDPEDVKRTLFHTKSCLPRSVSAPPGKVYWEAECSGQPQAPERGKVLLAARPLRDSGQTDDEDDVFCLNLIMITSKSHAFVKYLGLVLSRIM